MNRHLITIIAFLFLSACCKDGVEERKYLLTDADKAVIPYTANEAIPFIHSNGFEFDLVVTNQQTKSERTDTKHCGDYYSTYESYKVELKSNIPELSISLEVFPNEFDRFMIISFGRSGGFQLDLTSQPELDTLSLNGNEFYNVYREESSWSDTLVIRPKQILFSKEAGIIQITMSNNETFTIDE